MRKTSPQCPKCGKAIEFLWYAMQASEGGKYTGEFNWKWQGDKYEETYHCPECDALLAENEDDAMKILNLK